MFSLPSEEEFRLDIRDDFGTKKAEQVTKRNVVFYEISKPPPPGNVHSINRVPTLCQVKLHLEKQNNMEAFNRRMWLIVEMVVIGWKGFPEQGAFELRYEAWVDVNSCRKNVVSRENSMYKTSAVLKALDGQKSEEKKSNGLGIYFIFYK